MKEVEETLEAMAKHYRSRRTQEARELIDRNVRELIIEKNLPVYLYFSHYERLKQNHSR